MATFSHDADSSDPIAEFIASSGNERLRITTGGHILDGVTSRSYTGTARCLEIADTDVSVVLNSTNASGKTFALDSSYGGSGAYFGIKDVDSNTYRLYIDTDGDVGIGTTSPESGSILHVSGSGVTKPKFKSVNNSCLINIESTASTGQAGIQLLNSGVQKWEFRNTADDSHKLLFFDASSNNVLTIEQGGNISLLDGGKLFKLSVKSTSGDPDGVVGAIYYNSNAGKFRGCTAAGSPGTWVDLN